MQKARHHGLAEIVGLDRQLSSIYCYRDEQHYIKWVVPSRHLPKRNSAHIGIQQAYVLNDDCHSQA